MIDEYDVPLDQAYNKGYYDQMLSYYELEDKYDVVKAWYDGYQFGINEI